MTYLLVFCNSKWANSLKKNLRLMLCAEKASFRTATSLATKLYS